MSKVIEFDKLVRDCIPSIIWDEGNTLEYQMLDSEKDKELLGKYIRRKIREEAEEIRFAKTKTELISEVGDLMDIVSKLIAEEGITSEELAAARKEKQEKVGRFNLNLILKKITYYGDYND